jgi:hypothetical protein
VDAIRRVSSRRRRIGYDPTFSAPFSLASLLGFSSGSGFGFGLVVTWAVRWRHRNGVWVWVRVWLDIYDLTGYDVRF